MPKDDKKALEKARKELLAKAKKDGKIEQDLIFASIPEVPENTEVLDALYNDLAQAKIKVTNAVDSTPGFSDQWVEDEEEVVLDDKDYMDDIADDSVRLYL